jgi:MFS family permease
MTAPTTSLFQDLRALPGAFWVLCAGTFINRFGTFVYPFLTITLSRRGVSLWEIGIILAGYSVGSLLATLAGGWFADRFGRRRTIVLGTVSQAVAVMALYFAQAPMLLAFLTTVAGFFGGFYHPAANALVADLVAAERRLTAYAALRQAANGGFAFGVAAGGVLVNLSPFWLFAGDAITTGLFGVIAFLALPEGRSVAGREAQWSEAIGRIRRDGAFWALFAAQFTAAFIFAQFATSYALELGRRGVTLSLGDWQLASEQVYGLLMALNGVMIMALELPLTRVSTVFRPRRVMAVGYCLIGLGFAANIPSLGVGLLVAGMMIFTFGEMLVIPMVNVWIAHLAPGHMRGRYIGALGMAWALGNMTGQNLGLKIFAVSPEALWVSCAAAGFVAAALITLVGRGRTAAIVPQPV